jgi:hypothetical protein
MRDGYLRTLLVVGATAVIRYARTSTAAGSAWITELLAKKLAAVLARVRITEGSIANRAISEDRITKKIRNTTNCTCIL